VLAGEAGKVLVRVGVVFLELLDDILADIGVVLLDLLGPGTSAGSRRDLHSELVLGGDGGALASVSQQLLDKVGDVATGDGDVLDGGANDVALGDGDGVWN